MNADDQSVERPSHDDQSRDDADQLHREKPDDSDGHVYGDYEESEDSDAPACPWCGSRNGCDHHIALWSGGNSDWNGSLVDATESLHDALEWTLWRGYVLRGTQRQAPESCSCSLTRLVEATSRFGHDEDPENCDWWGPIRKYWMSVSEECGCEVLDHCFEGGAPGMSDHYKYVVAEHPEASISKIVQWAEKDVLDLRTWFELPTCDVPPTRSGPA